MRHVAHRGGRRARRSPRPAAALQRRHPALGVPAVRRPADVRQDGAARARRVAGGLVGVDGVLPGGASRRIRVGACHHPLSAAARGSGAASCGDGCGAAVPAGGAGCRLGRSARAGPGGMAVRPAARLHRPAVLRRLRQRTAAPGVVCAHAAPAGRRPVLPLRRIQYRFVCRAARLSVPRRAGLADIRTDASVDHRLRGARGADRAVRRDGARGRTCIRQARALGGAPAAPPPWRPTSPPRRCSGCCRWPST